MRNPETMLYAAYDVLDNEITVCVGSSKTISDYFAIPMSRLYNLVSKKNLVNKRYRIEKIGSYKEMML